MCRSLAFFLLVQIPDENSLRLQPNAPGSIRDKGRTDFGPSAVGLYQQALQCLTSLDALKTNKQYSTLKEYAEYAKTFTVDEAHSLRDGQMLLVQLISSLFPEKNYLAIIRALSGFQQ